MIKITQHLRFLARQVSIFYGAIFLIVMLGVPVELVSATENTHTTDSRPNILLIVVDDLAFTDLGAFGGEIKTPHLDKLARDGLRMTQFYTAATCSPTRAMLLTGVDHHLVGLGNMAEELAPNQKGQPGYEGYLNTRAASLPGRLREAGYATMMAGKWHLGLDENNSPAARGFEQSYALLQGGAGHLDDLALVGPGVAKYRENGKTVTLPKDFYSTRFFTDKTIDYIDSARKHNASKPFFAYLSYSAPHWPLQAPQASIARYKGLYDQGYEALALARKKRAVTEGVLSETLPAWQPVAGEKRWLQLSANERKREARRMEIYAAMVDDVDREVGRLQRYLASIDAMKNTLIVFMSDNGAEGHHLEQGWPELEHWVASCCDNSFSNMGSADSYLWLGPQWAAASSAGRRYYKGYVSEGGIRVPAFVHYPAMLRAQAVSEQYMHVMDIAPTLLQFAGLPIDTVSFQGRKVLPIQGRSMLPYLQQQADRVHSEHSVAAWELFGKRAVRQGDWKISLQLAPAGTGHWQLFNLAEDPTETQDLSLQRPEKYKEMQVLWQRYAAENGVVLPDWVSGY